jgi:putative DNA primase/helicase
MAFKPILIVDGFVDEATELAGKAYDVMLYDDATAENVRGRNVLFWPYLADGAKRADQLDLWANDVKRLMSGGKTPADFKGMSYSQFVAWGKVRVIESMPKDVAGVNGDYGITVLPPKNSPDDILREISTEELSEDALAIQFTLKNRTDWRYVAQWGSWMKWDGMRWKRETTLEAYDQIRELCREEAEASEQKSKKKCYSANIVAGVERLARADRAHAMTVDQWDLDPWQLNTPAGVLDLKHGATRPSDRTQFMTKVTLGSAITGDRPERWLSFLNDCTAGDMELQSYLARVAGYALTGSTEEHALFFFYGTGANGKSVFLNTLASVMGDYAGRAPIDTFMESRQTSHPTDIASLRGARTVIAMEVPDGKRWDEAKLKALTGGDKISARFMRQDFFEYTPQFKLLIAGNHKPGLRDVDEAMRRRLHLIPFTNTVPAEKRDPNLSKALLSEADGIMAWMLAGCLDWQARRLLPPQAVLDATEGYFSAEDSLQRWINECCTTHKQDACTTQELYESWKKWAEMAGEWIVSMKRFSENLSNRGFRRWKHPQNDRLGFSGIKTSIFGNELQ